jgi:hypothetical protein
MYTIFGLKNFKARDYSEDLSVDRKIILEWISGNSVSSCGLDASGSE